jgi:hypothetical protein
MPVSPDHLFVGNTCQYYAAARFLVHAQCIPVCGNLFHHAVEMLLKGGLAKKRKRKLSLSKLKKMGHKLKVLWREYKSDFPDPALKRHDKTISLLDKFEAIRYPDSTLKSGMGVRVQWFGPAVDVVTGAPPQVRQVRSIGHQTCRFDRFPRTVHRRQSRGQRQGIDANAVGVHERVDTDIKCIRAVLECLEGGRDVFASPDF